MKVFQLILFFLFLSSLVVISNNNLHLKDKNQAMEFGRLYYSWLYNTGANIVQTTGYVIKFDWLPNGDNTHVENETNLSK